MTGKSHGQTADPKQSQAQTRDLRWDEQLPGPWQPPPVTADGPPARLHIFETYQVACA